MIIGAFRFAARKHASTVELITDVQKLAHLRLLL